ncbi:collagen alpha-1(I) chain-like [Hippopotamus amphibius kiboko]|uniref:collagen alpha-1(I) chain-like n=1 Tax=Hippopotamus amphibius kiboko TaxID=575201 RepID=UPI002595494E|nr:collagen alpha-1(I) chain-like [Hippopotamus amphibius kiboko]
MPAGIGAAGGAGGARPSSGPLSACARRGAAAAPSRPGPVGSCAPAPAAARPPFQPDAPRPAPHVLPRGAEGERRAAEPLPPDGGAVKPEPLGRRGRRGRGGGLRGATELGVACGKQDPPSTRSVSSLPTPYRSADSGSGPRAPAQGVWTSRRGGLRRFQGPEMTPPWTCSYLVTELVLTQVAAIPSAGPGAVSTTGCSRAHVHGQVHLVKALTTVTSHG